jgi:hypothetical protein
MVEVQNCEEEAIPVQFSFVQNGGLIGIVAFPCLYHTPSLSDVTTVSKVCGLL